MGRQAKNSILLGRCVQQALRLQVSRNEQFERSSHRGFFQLKNNSLGEMLNYYSNREIIK
jgi:hypothetical protein